MTKPLKEMIFRPVEGTRRNVSGESETLAETLESLGILIDENCEFARIKVSKHGKYLVSCKRRKS